MPLVVVVRLNTGAAAFATAIKGFKPLQCMFQQCEGTLGLGYKSQ